jgi:dihydrofolate synthase/folylpolyglutamate synthase
MQDQPLLILDGAHNQQKIASLVKWFAREHPHTKPVVVSGFLESKDARAMLDALTTLASTLVLTEPNIEDKPPTSAVRLAEITRELAFDGELQVESDPRQAVDLAIELARKKGQPVLVTGSLYLAGNVRGRWYPDDEVLFQRTPWPRPGRSQ